MITDDRAEKAFDYLHETTSAIGAARAELERSEILRKRIRKRYFLESSGTVAEREAKADTFPEVGDADDRYIEAVEKYEAMKAKRDIESIALDVWRTESANRRRA
jgi:hypothetical protein